MISRWKWYKMQVFAWHHWLHHYILTRHIASFCQLWWPTGHQHTAASGSLSKMRTAEKVLKGHSGQKGGPVQRSIWWATWGFRLQKKTILHPSHLLATWHSSIFWSSLENHQAIKDLQIFGPAKNWGHSLFGLNPSNQRKRTAPKSGASWHSAFPRLSRWKLSGSSRLDMLDLQAFLHHRPHEIQPLVVFEKSGFFGWNQGIQQFSSARKILRKTWTSSFTTVSSHIHTQPVLGCRPLNQPGSPGDSPS